MKTRLILKEGSNPNYLATICQIKEIYPIEGADRVVKTVINGYDMIISKDIKIGDVVVYVPVETVICHEFLSRNNFYDVSCYELNENKEEVEKLLEQRKSLESKLSNAYKEVDKEIKSKCGFFNKHGRVRILKLRGQYSMGFLIPWDQLLHSMGLDMTLQPEIGYQFNYIGDIEFCKKYVVSYKENEHVGTGKGGKATRRAYKRFDRLIEDTFQFHYDTKQLGEHFDTIDPSDYVSISVKCHGCVERNTIINTLEYGDKTIGEIIDNKIKCNIKSFNTQTNKIEYSPIEQFYYIPNDGDWYEIELEDGRKITITGNNPVWLPELKCYRRVDELVGNEKLLVNVS